MIAVGELFAVGLSALAAAQRTAAGTSPWPWLLLLAIATAAGLFLPRVLSKRACAQRRWLRTHQQLASANGLSAAESRLLWRIGVGAGLDNPALVFVRPTLFESRAAMAQIDPQVVTAIRSKVFGS